MLTISLILIGALCYGWLSRMCGGGRPSLPLGLDGILYASVYGMVTFYVVHSGVSLVVCAIATLAAFGTALLGKRMGHGRFIDLGTWVKEASREKIEYLMYPLWSLESKNVRLYDCIGLALTGLVVVLGASISIWLCTGNVLLSGCLVLGGVSKALAYLIGWSVNPTNEEPLEATMIGEFLTGFFAGISLGIAFI